MNSPVIILTICALFVAGVRSTHFCRQIKDNAENLAILESCLSDNYAQPMLNLVTSCYRSEFGVSEGNWLSFVTDVLCDHQPDQRAKFEKFQKCLADGEDAAMSEAGITEDQFRAGGLASQRCVSEKLEGRPSDYHMDEIEVD